MTYEQIKQLFPENHDVYRFNGNINELQEVLTGRSISTITVQGQLYFVVVDYQSVPDDEKIIKI